MFHVHDVHVLGFLNFLNCGLDEEDMKGSWDTNPQLIYVIESSDGRTYHFPCVTSKICYLRQGPVNVYTVIAFKGI